MEFRTTFSFPESAQKIQHGEKIISLGSCFSENMGEKLHYFGWDVLNNPFGTLFHPLAITNLLLNAIYDDKKVRICQKDNLFYTYESHSAIVGGTSEELENCFQQKQAELINKLNESDWLIVTFGSAWSYLLDGEIVANCHKQHQSLFKKEITELTELQIVWRTTIRLLKDKFPRLKLIFSLSPVRHIKDGVIENQRSKARLIELIHSLEVYYFPAYELVMDDLRDYRFYARDKVHPSPEAIDYIFECFSQSCIDRNAIALFPMIDQLRKEELHRSLSKESEAFVKFVQKHQIKKNEFLERYPNLNW